MPNDTSIFARIKTWILALLPEQWSGSAGKRFRETVKAINAFAAESHLRPNELLEADIELGRRKLAGLAKQDYAQAVKDFAEAEAAQIERELTRRMIESKHRKEIAEAQKLEAEVRLAKLRVMEAELELIKKLNELGVALEFRVDGTFVVRPKPESCDFNELLSKEQQISGEPTGKYE